MKTAISLKAQWECEDQSEAFQRVGPGTADAPYDFFAIDYWPCKYTEGADPVALRAVSYTHLTLPTISDV